MHFLSKETAQEKIKGKMDLQVIEWNIGKIEPLVSAKLQKSGLPFTQIRNRSHPAISVACPQRQGLTREPGTYVRSRVSFSPKRKSKKKRERKHFP
ncbi:hypothetical protein CEXT_691461 [Caerostris extrusa]|uniref:Ribosomal protein S13 n=1 Tax=Caerostris extrusa TaxID=172846 RepID=A0AAV4SNS6_CAEEX|nr:hypothetical protein CEXT_691461 [Caerostris extrusa]